MSVTHVIPGGLSEGRRVQSRAISKPLQFGAGRWPVLAVTSDRAHRVGRPTTAPRRPSPDVDPLVAEAAATGLETLGLLEQRALEAALDFRWRRVANGRRALMELVNGIQSIVQLAVSAADTTGIDLEFLCETDGRGATEATRRAVNTLIADQRSEDWLVLADTLEARFIPALDCWRAVFDALAGSGDFDPEGFAA